MNITIYSKNNCPNCFAAINMAQQIIQGSDNSLVIEKIDENEAAKNTLLLEVPHAKSLPQIFVDGNHIGGLNEFLDWKTATNGGAFTVF